MNFDYNKTEQLTGLHFDNTEQLYFYVLQHLEFLKVHNKNYTKKQYYKTNDLFDIISSVIFDN
jgi:hypothetical protein